MKRGVLKFIDLFAGIGGFHMAFHNEGAECVFVSEWDEAARKTYEANYKKYHQNFLRIESAYLLEILQKLMLKTYQILTY